jgi:Aminoglycoside-2''-adenylyltransferase
MPAVIGFDYSELWKWEDFDPSRLSSLMTSFDAPWWVAGGRALDLWMGRQTRAHQDVDVAILRDDQKRLHEAFGGWELYFATIDHRLVPYRSDRWLEVPLYGVWARPAPDAPWLGEFLLKNEHEDQQWVYRRNPAVRKPLDEVGVMASAGGVPILVPEIVLLYKAHELTEKDEADFRSALPHLTVSRKAWLLGALDKTRPNHRWVRRLRG